MRAMSKKKGWFSSYIENMRKQREEQGVLREKYRKYEEEKESNAVIEERELVEKRRELERAKRDRDLEEFREKERERRKKELEKLSNEIRGVVDEEN